jgi:hypothetical protein
MMTPRTMPRWARERPVTRHCQQPLCGTATRQGKPFCSAHVDEHPYVKNLLARIDGKHAEEARVRDRGSRAVDPNGLTSQEILRFLIVHGERTVPRLARDLNVDLGTLRAYVSALARKHRVSLGENKRGATLIRYREVPAPKRRRRSSNAPADSPQTAEPV